MRATRELSGKDALSQLEGINTALGCLLEYVTAFTSWWADVVGHLVAMKNHVTHLSLSKMETCSVDLIKERWIVIANQYRSYSREVNDYTRWVA